MGIWAKESYAEWLERKESEEEERDSRQRFLRKLLKDLEHNLSTVRAVARELREWRPWLSWSQLEAEAKDALNEADTLVAISPEEHGEQRVALFLRERELSARARREEAEQRAADRKALIEAARIAHERSGTTTVHIPRGLLRRPIVMEVES